MKRHNKWRQKLTGTANRAVLKTPELTDKTGFQINYLMEELMDLKKEKPRPLQRCEASINRNETTLSTLHCERKYATDFVHLLTGDAKNPLTFQLFHESERNKAPKILHGSIYDHWDTFVDLNKEGYGIFVMINEGDLQGRKAENVTKVRALFVDLDGAPITPILQEQIQPHIVVSTSRNKFHVYWLVNDCPLEEFSKLQKALAKKFNGDPAVSDLSRVMRLPGLYHMKNPGKPFLTKMLEEM